MTQFPKLVSALCATLFCAGTLTVQAEDNAAQAAARAVLLQELQQVPTPQTNDTSAPPVTQAPPATPPAVAAPPVTSPPVAPPPAPAGSAPGRADNADQAVARALLLQQLASPSADSNPLTTPPAVSSAPVAGTVVITVNDDEARQVKAAADAEAARAAKAKAAADAKAAREARAAALAEAARQKASATPAAEAAPATSSAAVLGQPIRVPAPPISADQAARLQALDAKYTANQISPADYFNQREAILSGQ